MCFTIIGIPEKLIAEKDIVCYKYGELYSNIFERTILVSAVMDFKYKFKKLYKVELDEPYLFRSSKEWCIYNGFHSNKYTRYSNVKCIIKAETADAILIAQYCRKNY